MAAPTWIANGTAQSGGAVALTVPWPTHQVDDIALLIMEGVTAPGLGTANGFVRVPDAPQITTTVASALDVYWCRATSTSMASPITNAFGNHGHAIIAIFRGCITTGDPWDVTSGGTNNTNDAVISATGDTTTLAECCIVFMATHGSDFATAEYSGEAAANVTSLTERYDAGTATGNGGGIGLWVGERATAGAYGPLTGNLVNNSGDSFISIALKPPAATTHELAATVAGVATVTGNLTRVLQAKATPAGVATVTADLDLIVHLASTVAGVATVTSNLTRVQSFASTIAGIATVTANASQIHQLATSTIGVATVNPDLETIVEVKARTVARIS